MKTKQELRDFINDTFSSISPEEIELKSCQIRSKIEHYFDINTFTRVCIYENYSDEVITKNLIDSLRIKWLKIYTPQMIWETEMILIDEEYEHYEKEIDVFIVPGRAFTPDGKRLGRGRWYYDRFLSNKLYKKSRKIGICFDFQILEDIPVQKYDILMNKIIRND